MLFHTLPFFIFLAVAGTLVYWLNRDALKKMVLLGASYLFYMWWNPYFIVLIFASTLVDYIAARQIVSASSKRKRRLWLIASLSVNLGFLGFFKYYYFILANINGALMMAGMSPFESVLTILLPVGISFYTFQSMSYTIDVYRGQIPVCRSFADFALYVSFFPQLVAGPIVRAKDFLPQLKTPIRMQFSEAAFFLFMRGLAKKVLVADNLAPFVDAIFTDPGAWPSVIIWMATLAFYIQIYCDFSGYTDMAIAVAQLFGFHLPKNFNRPMFARTPSDFWQRWHISLSQWLRDYLYIPLGGNRKGTIFTYRNLMITMLLGGLWHGASWSFIIWGGLHGLALVIHRAYSELTQAASWKIKIESSSVYQIASWVLIQYWVMITWIPFRILDPDAMTTALTKFVWFDGSLSISGIGLGNLSFFSTLAIMAAFLAVHFASFMGKGLDEILPKTKPAAKFGFCIAAGLLFFYLWPSSQQPYIYFQF